MAKRALVTGITGQDGAYLAQLLLAKGYEVFGGVHKSPPDLSRLAYLGICDDVKIVRLDVLDLDGILRCVEEVAPDEVYNLAAQSFVQASFDNPVYTGDCGALGVTRLLEALRKLRSNARFYQASTSEMFGNADESPQSETTPLRPLSPYGVAKLYGHLITATYRASYGMHSSCGILFNHESPLRGRAYVTRKITLGLARFKQGQQSAIELGNLNAKRDWGFAGDFVDGIWRMLQQERPGDYVLATGECHSVREFVVSAAEAVGLDVVFEGTGMNERGIDRASGREVVRVSPHLYRPADIHQVVGDSSKAREVLGWAPRTKFVELITLMADADIQRVRADRLEF